MLEARGENSPARSVPGLAFCKTGASRRACPEPVEGDAVIGERTPPGLSPMSPIVWPENEEIPDGPRQEARGAETERSEGRGTGKAVEERLGESIAIGRLVVWSYGPWSRRAGRESRTILLIVSCGYHLYSYQQSFEARQMEQDRGTRGQNGTV